jgi:outer membrane biosynthesis protein TonB
MKFDKREISGLLVLFIGVGLLAFTFLNAYWLLKEDIGIVASQDLVAAFGEAMAPLIATVIHVMYLGIMGWIGSLLTLRGIHILATPKTVVTSMQPLPKQPTTQIQSVSAAKKEKTDEKIVKPPPPTEPEAKPVEEPEKEPEKPETGIAIEVRPPEQVAEPPQTSPSPAQPQTQQQTQQ